MEINIREVLCSVLITKYHSGDQIKKNEMGGTYGKCWEQERCIKGLGENTSWKDVNWKT